MGSSVTEGKPASESQADSLVLWVFGGGASRGRRGRLWEQGSGCQCLSPTHERVAISLVHSDYPPPYLHNTHAHHVQVVDGPSDELRYDALDTICALAMALGQDFAIFVPTLCKVRPLAAAAQLCTAQLCRDQC
jgi:hypothetical protein